MASNSSQHSQWQFAGTASALSMPNISKTPYAPEEKQTPEPPEPQEMLRFSWGLRRTPEILRFLLRTPERLRFLLRTPECWGFSWELQSVWGFSWELQSVWGFSWELQSIWGFSWVLWRVWGFSWTLRRFQGVSWVLLSRPSKEGLTFDWDWIFNSICISYGNHISPRTWCVGFWTLKIGRRVFNGFVMARRDLEHWGAAGSPWSTRSTCRRLCVLLISNVLISGIPWLLFLLSQICDTPLIERRHQLLLVDIQ